MELEQRDRVLFKLQGGWSRPMADPTLLIFSEKLTPLNFERAMKATDSLIEKMRTRPVWADFREHYDATRHEHGDRALPPPVCGICDDGWVDVTPDKDKRGFIGTVTRCPNGCLPMTSEEREAKYQREDALWRATHTPAQEAENRARIAAMLRWLTETPHTIITEQVIDRAGVPNWRQRLRDANDPVAEWQRVRAEAGFPPLDLPDMRHRSESLETSGATRRADARYEVDREERF